MKVLCAVVSLAMLGAGYGRVQAQEVQRFPASGAKGVNPDTHLVLTFTSAPVIGKSGQIRIYDMAGHKLVDTLDMSIPAGPDPAHRVGTPDIDPKPPTPTTTTPAVKSVPADLHSYQLNTVGGLADFHFYPVIVHGNVATIYPHNGVLRYHRRYVVEMDPGVLTPAGGSFAGFKKSEWTFATKSAGPKADATRVVVAADGTGDFNTVQGAVDFVPANPVKRVTIFIRNGTYEEIVFFQKKSNITFEGEDREKVQVGYANNSAFNPPMPGPSRRCAFSVYDSNGIVLENFSVSNYVYGQAEGLLVYGDKVVVKNVNIKGSGDALNLRGRIYLEGSRIIGDGDTILGVGAAFFKDCEIQSMGPYMWIRNTEANHGNVFVNCTFLTRQRPAAQRSADAAMKSAPARPSMGAVLARLPNNHGLNYPYAEAVLIHCKLSGIPPMGWGPVEADPAHLHLWEYGSTDLGGKPIDVSKRHPASRQLTMEKDAETIANYSKPSFVLGGWDPTEGN
ncbi:MAG TPA: pectinesterase family protein [Edaphobacter sp.]